MAIVCRLFNVVGFLYTRSDSHLGRLLIDRQMEGGGRNREALEKWSRKEARTVLVASAATLVYVRCEK